MLNFLKTIFGDKHEKEIKKYLPIVEEINKIFDELKNLSDEELKQKTFFLKSKIKSSTDILNTELISVKEKIKSTELNFDEFENLLVKQSELDSEIRKIENEILDEILPEAFAIVKETCRRLYGQSWEVAGNKIIWEMIPFDVQLIGGMVLHDGKISEMATGEGKTLVATLPIFLNSLTGRGVHLVTVNDYLASRDSEWMKRIFEFHDISIGCILQNMDSRQRRIQYNCDITYGTNNEFGFDYLRDNMVHDPEEAVQRVHNYAIVDEVDSVLIDEARTPLIISGAVDSDDTKFNEMKPRVDKLVNTQKNLIANIVTEAEKYLNENKKKEAGVLLLRAHRGYPKNKKLLKIFSDGGSKKLMLETESEYMAEQNKRMHEIVDELYFAIDEKAHSIDLTDKGRDLLSSGLDKEFFIIPDITSEFSQIEVDENLSPEAKQNKKDEHTRLYSERSERIHTVTQLLRAYSLYEKDVEYVVQDAKVQIVDEFTGRVLQGRRYSDGLHQAIEAKEGVKIERDTQTLATITLQNYFRLYKKLGGMTGTAETEASEFFDIYKLDVNVIPTNKDITRDDLEDKVYKTKREKYNAILAEIETMKKENRPILVGTTSVEVSEVISRLLKRNGVTHNVLNAKQHQREAEIVAHAGLPGAVTIATNMAGRGTDIKLGPGVKDAGGLHIIGTERHEARRIDRQLRGRAGRQGDPGSSQFFISLEDDLMRLFGSDRIASIMERMGLEEGEVIQHSMITKSIERAQKKVEENNYGIRKRLLEYDNVMNQQREIIYSLRRSALFGENLRIDILNYLNEYISDFVNENYDSGEIDLIQNEFRTNLLIDWKISPAEYQTVGLNGVVAQIENIAKDFYSRKENLIGKENLSHLERWITLNIIDSKWKEHLREMDDLKEGIYLRAYGQKDPLVEYKGEAFKIFSELISALHKEIVHLCFKMFPEKAQTEFERNLKRPQKMVLKHDAATGLGMQGNSEENQPKKPQVQQIHVEEKIGRNDSCPCGSGKKYKQCHGKN